MNIQKIYSWLPFLGHKEAASSRSVGLMALTSMVLCASTYNTFAKLLTESLSPITLVFLSEALTAFFVLFSFGALPTIKKMVQLPLHTLAPMVAIGLLSGIIGPLLWFLGLHNSTAINAALFGNGEMVFMAMFAIIMLHEPFGRQHLLSILTIIAGIVVIALKGFTDGFSLQGGDTLLVLSCMSYAGGSIVFRKYLHHCEPHLVILARSALSVTAFFLASPFMQHPLIEEIMAFPIILLPILLGFGFISRFLNLFSFYEALEHLPVTTVSLSLNMTVVGSIAFASWFLGEQLEMYHFIGGALVITGALLLELSGLHPTEKHLESHLQQATPRV